ncbi:MAG TPA: DoxX family protein [Vicinamibacterales bacterium]|nr:DoxX family protein [Vicinamibacterales bacterium]
MPVGPAVAPRPRDSEVPIRPPGRVESGHIQGGFVIPERYAPYTYALFRIVFGLLFFCFGLQKVAGLFGGQAVQLMSLQGAAGTVETVCGFLIMIGLFTRPAAFLASGEMAVAFWYIHVMTIAMGKGLGIPAALVPLNNGGVDSVAFCFAFLYICSRGAGLLSVDRSMGRKS